MSITTFISKLRTNPNSITFEETITIIDTYYNFEPSLFTNGEVTNNPGENNGSCKIFSFAKLHHLDVEETLFCFGRHYKKVLDTPEDTDHQNIRNFMRTGWDEIFFKKETLSAK